MDQQLALLLPMIVGDRNLHARWLNTFSYLEYIGFRKIIKSQNAEQLDIETLQHAVEESRHAFLLKKLAVNMGGDQFKKYSPDSLLCGRQAAAYFQSLDCMCEKLVSTSMEQSARLIYLYVTWLVELRAITVYGYYQEALTDVGLKSPLNGLLAEEDKHLIDVELELLQSDPHFSSRAASLKAVEEELYTAFLLALTRELQASEKFFEAKR